MQPNAAGFSTEQADRPWSLRMADAALERYPIASARWHYEDGVLLRAVEQAWLWTGEPRYRQAIEAYGDRFVSPEGTILTYRADEYNLDQVNAGKLLFGLHQATQGERYRRALSLLREQLRQQPRTPEGGFWHKLIYPHQMWLDGSYMASPFLAEYAQAFQEPDAWNEAVRQIITIAEHTRDPRTGLLYHAWDESRQQRWADPHTGCSPHFWGRAVGWFLMAVVDILDFLPEDHPRRATLLEIFRETVAAVGRVQDTATGAWHQILDRGGQAGNYLEASGSCMFVYAIAKAVRMKYLGGDWIEPARCAYAGVLRHMIGIDGHGRPVLYWTCGTAGLGGMPYRDGSYEYYVGERIVINDLKGVGAFILAAGEMERGSTAPTTNLETPGIERQAAERGEMQQNG